MRLTKHFYRLIDGALNQISVLRMNWEINNHMCEIQYMLTDCGVRTKARIETNRFWNIYSGKLNTASSKQTYHECRRCERARYKIVTHKLTGSKRM